MNEREQFNAAYWGSFAPVVQALSGLEAFSAERMDAAIALAQSGHLIDHQIQAVGASAYETMKLRELYGYTWVPSLLQPPVPIAPGIAIPGQPMYDATAPPAGSIKVSSKIEDYPPFLVASTVVAPPQADPVPARPCLGVMLGAGKAAVMPGDYSEAGTRWPSGSDTWWVKRIVQTPFGCSAWWEEVN